MACEINEIKEEKMREMIYQKDRKRELLARGTYLNHRWAIMTQGWFPTAYVEHKIPNLKDYTDDLLFDIKVHGGFTYSGEAYWDKTDDGDYLGWDYGHLYDHCGYTPEDDGRQYTTEEIYLEVKNVIEQLRGLNNE